MPEKSSKGTRLSMDELLARATTSTKGCFYRRLPPDAKAFFNEAVVRLKEGVPISQTGIARVLREEFNIRLGHTVIGDHIRGACSCLKD